MGVPVGTRIEYSGFISEAAQRENAQRHRQLVTGTK
jgi:hypothetical protein